MLPPAERSFIMRKAFYFTLENLHCGTVLADTVEEAEELVKKAYSMDLAEIRECEKGKEVYEVVEYCPYCEYEAILHLDPEKTGYVAVCPHCGKEIFLCDECLHADDNRRRKCDWHAGPDGIGMCFRGLTKN